MNEESFYPKCGLCEKGTLLPVNLGAEGEGQVKYRCTNPECTARFDEHGYETYDPEEEVWIRKAGSG